MKAEQIRQKREFTSLHVNKSRSIRRERCGKSWNVEFSHFNWLATERKDSSWTFYPSEYTHPLCKQFSRLVTSSSAFAHLVVGQQSFSLHCTSPCLYFWLYAIALTREHLPRSWQSNCPMLTFCNREDSSRAVKNRSFSLDSNLSLITSLFFRRLSTFLPLPPDSHPDVPCQRKIVMPSCHSCDFDENSPAIGVNRKTSQRSLRNKNEPDELTSIISVIVAVTVVTFHSRCTRAFTPKRLIVWSI